MGTFLLIIGAIFLLNPTTLNIKVGFTSILIGIFMIVMITEKSVTKKTSNAMVEGNIDFVKRLITKLNLEGNAIFLPKSKYLSEERVLIPPNKSGTIQIPNVRDDNLFLTSKAGEKLGVSIPPSGLKLLKEIEKDGSFNNIGMGNIEEKLQKFVGLNLLKSITFTRQQNGYKLELEKLVFCPKDPKLCRQYPCPTCSAIITMITRAASKNSENKLLITDSVHNGKKTTFQMNLIKKRTEKRN